MNSFRSVLSVMLIGINFTYVLPRFLFQNSWLFTNTHSKGGSAKFNRNMSLEKQAGSVTCNIVE